VRGFTGTEGTGIAVEDPPTDSGGGGSNPGPDPQDTSQPPQELSDCVKNLLAKYFDRSQLDAIRVHTNGLPWFVPRDKSAYTSSNHVYYAQGQLILIRPEGSP
jgi:hypothetical protein